MVAETKKHEELDNMACNDNKRRGESFPWQPVNNWGSKNVIFYKNVSKREENTSYFYKNITNRTCAQLERKREATFEVTGLLRVFIGAERREERKENGREGGFDQWKRT